MRVEASVSRIQHSLSMIHSSNYLAQRWPRRLTTLSRRLVSVDEGLQSCLKRTVVTRPLVLGGGRLHRFL